MTALAWLIPIALLLGLLGLIAFMWALRTGQFDDLEGAAYRILEDDREEPTAPETAGNKPESPPAEDKKA
jgi:cbb3-type cytochrome oxidase maturation protein